MAPLSLYNVQEAFNLFWQQLYYLQNLVQITTITNSLKHMFNMGPMNIIDESALSRPSVHGFIDGRLRQVLPLVFEGSHSKWNTGFPLPEKSVNFITPEEWMPKSPYAAAAPMDFSIWGILKRR